MPGGDRGVAGVVVNDVNLNLWVPGPITEAQVDCVRQGPERLRETADAFNNEVSRLRGLSGARSTFSKRGAAGASNPHAAAQRFVNRAKENEPNLKH